MVAVNAIEWKITETSSKKQLKRKTGVGLSGAGRFKVLFEKSRRRCVHRSEGAEKL